MRPRLAEIDCPTLVLVGRHDWVCPPAGGLALADAIPDAELVELDTGHFGFSETPDVFLSAVRAHIRRVQGGRKPATTGMPEEGLEPPTRGS